jgi:hypothetical protein
MINKLGLPISGRIVINLIEATGDPEQFIEVCENIFMTINIVIHCISIFVLDKLAQEFVLERAYQRQSRIFIENDDNKSCKVTVRSANNKQITTF